nr:PREDICTED: uncharacterized protein LOC108227464 isoform X3 [Daucus carota subsp. sativus]
MKNLTRCYSEHAIKVSDSYCSGQSRQAILSPKMNKTSSTKDTVTCTYKVQCPGQIQIFVAVTWFRVKDQGFTISIIDDPSSPFKFNAKHLQFGTSRVLLNSELILLLGDKEDLEVNKIIYKISFKPKFRLFSRSERLSGSSAYSTKARFFDKGRSHDIVIRCIAEDRMQRELVLSVFIDERNVIEIKRLHWNFRGNETVYIDGCLVDMMWDVHDWLFNPKSGDAHFMFRPRAGLDCRLWLAEDKLERNEQENCGVSWLICAAKNPD